MSNVKLIIQYPNPHDVYVFDKAYLEELMPFASKELEGKTKIVDTAPQPHTHHALPSYHRITEIYFPSMEALLACTESEAGKKFKEQSAEISTGGAPNFIIAEEEVTEF